MTSTLDPVESYSAAWTTDLINAIKAATKRDAFTLDKIPADLDRDYVEVHLASRFTDSAVRGGGMRDDLGWRLSLRVVCKNLADGRLMEDRIRRRFRAPVVLGGVDTLVRYESGGGDFDRDDERYYHALTDFIFVR